MAPVAESGFCPAWIARVSNSIAVILVTVLDLPDIEEVSKACKRLVRARRISPGTEDLERLRLSVEPRLDATDESVPDEDRQDVVAVLALRLWHVHLESVPEVEQLLRAVAIVDQAVE